MISHTSANEALRILYPNLTESELKEAEATLRRYLEITAEIEIEQSAQASGGEFDSSPPPPMIEERSNVTLKN